MGKRGVKNRGVSEWVGWGLETGNTRGAIFLVEGKEGGEGGWKKRRGKGTFFFSL